MLVKLLVICNYVAFVSPALRMRPMKEIVQRNKPIHRQKHLCGPTPQPWDDCEPSLCSVMSLPGSNPELQHLTTCVPLNLPSHQLWNKKLKVVPLALRAVLTSSTLGPFDNGESPKLRCPGLAICRTLDTYKQKTTTTPIYSIDTTNKDGEKTTTNPTNSIDTTNEDGEKITTTPTNSIYTTNKDGEKITPALYTDTTARFSGWPEVKGYITDWVNNHKIWEVKTYNNGKETSHYFRLPRGFYINNKSKDEETGEWIVDIINSRKEVFVH